MAKRNITLVEVNELIEQGEYKQANENHAWIYYDSPTRDDNLVCAAIINKQAIIIKTIMIRWELRSKQ